MSKGFSMANGDVIVAETIAMTNGNELLRQKLERIVATNRGEWKHDLDEGIDFSVVLCKNPDEDEIRATIEEAIMHIDDSLMMTDFKLTTEGRTANISFTVVTDEGEEVEVRTNAY